jgi:Protein of unknown function (DUF3568)
MIMRTPSMILAKAFSIATAAAALSLACGCLVIAAGAAGAGTVAYVRGELDATVGSDYERVIDASNRALDQVQFVRISEKRDAFSAVIIARTAEDKKVEIRLTKEGDRLTKVQIRIGVFGNEERSRVILEKIQAGA